MIFPAPLKTHTTHLIVWRPKPEDREHFYSWWCDCGADDKGFPDRDAAKLAAAIHQASHTEEEQK